MQLTNQTEIFMMQGADYTDRSYWQGTIKMSLSKFFVLSVLHHKPMHGYQVVQAVEKTTNGCCSPSEGTVYPVLNEFEAGGYMTSHTEVVNGRQRKVYALTDKGRDAFRVATEAWMNVTQHILATRDAVAPDTDQQNPSGNDCCA